MKQIIDIFDRAFAVGKRRGFHLFLFVLVLIPLIVRPYNQGIFIEAMLFAIVAVSLNLLVGYTGLVSFGQAALFGVPAYVTGILLVEGVVSSFWLALLAGAVASVIVALIMGYLSLQRKGLYFAMITLAVAQMFYLLASINLLGMTGGLDGIYGIPRGNFGIPGVIKVDLLSTDFYYLTLAILILQILLVKRIINSPYGLVLKCIRENEQRVRYNGYNTFIHKLTAFVISGLMAGVAGSLYVSYLGTMNPAQLSWLTSGNALIMVLIGGMGTLVGPVIGAFLYISVKYFTPEVIEWEFIFGAIALLVIYFYPRGIVSLFIDKE